MKLKQTPELHTFLSVYFSDIDTDADQEAIQQFLATSSEDQSRKVILQLQNVLNDIDFPIEELGSEANRWFGSLEEAQSWLKEILQSLQAQGVKTQNTDSLVVKDSNGASLSEGDSVQVIKDLKVKGGSSDLKRGTLIKKIHLIGDPGAIECRVDGSTLVLKTCFLKKV
jgi:protein PhnA